MSFGTEKRLPTELGLAFSYIIPIVSVFILTVSVQMLPDLKDCTSVKTLTYCIHFFSISISNLLLVYFKSF